MERIGNTDERNRLDAEIEALQRWCDDLTNYMDKGLRDPGVSIEEFSNAATMFTRVLIRLKALYDRAGIQDRERRNPGDSAGGPAPSLRPIGRRPVAPR